MTVKQVTFYPRYIADVDYNSRYDCTENGNCSICRCRVLENLQVTSVKLSMNAFAFKESYLTKANHKRSREYEPSMIELYCIDRLARVHGVYDAGRYNVHAEAGYYGEEVGGINFDGEDALTSSINEMLNMSADIDKIKFVLTKEYSFLLEKLEPTATVSIKKIELDDFILNKEYLERVKMNSSTDYEFMITSVTEMSSDLPVGVVLATKDGYRLIDGYHRLSALKLKGAKSAPYICLM